MNTQNKKINLEEKYGSMSVDKLKESNIYIINRYEMKIKNMNKKISIGTMTNKTATDEKIKLFDKYGIHVNFINKIIKKKQKNNLINKINMNTQNKKINLDEKYGSLSLDKLKESNIYIINRYEMKIKNMNKEISNGTITNETAIDEKIKLFDKYGIHVNFINKMIKKNNDNNNNDKNNNNNNNINYKNHNMPINNVPIYNNVIYIPYNITYTYSQPNSGIELIQNRGYEEQQYGGYEGQQNGGYEEYRGYEEVQYGGYEEPKENNISTDRYVPNSIFNNKDLREYFCNEKAMEILGMFA